MKSNLIGLMIALSFSIAAHAADNELTAAEKKDGWELLFDGKGINKSWRGYKMDSAPTKWEIEDGAIFLNPNNYGTGGDIVGIVETCTCARVLFNDDTMTRVDCLKRGTGRQTDAEFLWFDLFWATNFHDTRSPVRISPNI